MLGEKLLTKIWETVARDGIAALAAPWQIRREGRARLDVRRQEMLTLAQAEKDADAIRHGRKQLLHDGTIQERSEEDSTALRGDAASDAPEHSNSSILAAAYAKQEADRIQSEVNLSRTLLFAEEESGTPDEEVSEEAVDPDWFRRWRESAEQVQAEELQRLWARTLAGEVKAPGTYSLRTLDFLRNLTKAEAEQITRVAPYVFGNFLPKFDDAALQSVGITFATLLDLEDMGFVTGHSGIGLQKTLESQQTDRYFSFLVNHSKILLLERESPQPPVTIKGAALTRVGREVISLGQFSPDLDYVRKFAEHLKESGVTVKVADWFPRPDGTGDYRNAVAL